MVHVSCPQSHPFASYNPFCWEPSQRRFGRFLRRKVRAHTNRASPIGDQAAARPGMARKPFFSPIFLFYFGLVSHHSAHPHARLLATRAHHSSPPPPLCPWRCVFTGVATPPRLRKGSPCVRIDLACRSCRGRRLCGFAGAHGRVRGSTSGAKGATVRTVPAYSSSLSPSSSPPSHAAPASPITQTHSTRVRPLARVERGWGRERKQEVRTKCPPHPALEVRAHQFLQQRVVQPFSHHRALCRGHVEQ